jgi:ABC-type spermidine/putrescine transport system permease subunit II
VLVYPTFTIPFATWLLMGFFKSIPRDLEDAAMVDGLSRFSAFVKVIVPISFSGLVTASIFAFTLVLQEFVYALTFISSASLQTVGVGVPIYLVRGDVYYWGELMAACLFACVPVAIVYNLFLDRCGVHRRGGEIALGGGGLVGGRGLQPLRKAVGSRAVNAGRAQASRGIPDRLVDTGPLIQES